MEKHFLGIASILKLIACSASQSMMKGFVIAGGRRGGGSGNAVSDFNNFQQAIAHQLYTSKKISFCIVLAVAVYFIMDKQI